MRMPRRILDVALWAWELWRGNARSKAGISLITGGTAVLAPSVIVTIIQLAAQGSAAGGDPNAAPWWVATFIGVSMVATGVYLIVTLPQEAKATVIAIRHQSQEALSSSISPRDLPWHLRKANIFPVNIDQSTSYREGCVSDPVGALRQQQDLLPRVKAMLDGHPGAEIAYYGIAHVPFVFLAGVDLSTKARLNLFELDRGTGNWRYVDADFGGRDLGVSVAEGDGGPDAIDIAVRISISFTVNEALVAACLGRPFHDRHLSVPAPGRDIVTSMDQVEEVATQFNRLLDDIKERFPLTHRVHVFYAGPVSLAFSLGRRISRTNHHRIFVHNYEARSTPEYRWAVEMSGDMRPEDRVVWADPASAAAAAAE